ncbi:hypothetical protein VTK56DRAFT_2349 [Thermocarpiscus australiensis]
MQIYRGLYLATTPFSCSSPSTTCFTIQQRNLVSAGLAFLLFSSSFVQPAAGSTVSSRPTPPEAAEMTTTARHPNHHPSNITASSRAPSTP